MEICRKLDSIRMCGFPDGNSVPIGAPGDTSPLDDPPRPSSEPLPEFIPATNAWKERPGTAAADSDILGRIEDRQGGGGGSSSRKSGSNDVNSASGGEGGAVARGSCTTTSPAVLQNGRLGTNTTGVCRNLGEDVDSGGGEGLDNGHAHGDEKYSKAEKKGARVSNNNTGYTLRDKVRDFSAGAPT